MLSQGINIWGGEQFAPLFGETKLFTSTWDTTQAGSASDTIVLPYAGGNTTDWGDGTINTSNTHTYAVGGIKTVTIEGSLTGFRFNNGGDKSKIITVSNTGELVLDGNSMFRGCDNMTTWIANNAILTTSTSFSAMFRSCRSLLVLDISSIDSSSVDTMSTMFFNCEALETLDVTTLDTSAVTTTASMFFGCSLLISLIGVEDFIIDLVTNMGSFLSGVTLPTSQYSDLLVNYEAQSVQNNVSFSGGSSQYSVGAATTARADLISDHTWTITDGGQA